MRRRLGTAVPEEVQLYLVCKITGTRQEQLGWRGKTREKKAYEGESCFLMPWECVLEHVLPKRGNSSH